LRLEEDEGAAPKDVQYSLYKDARGVLKVNAPNVVPREKRRK